MKQGKPLGLVLPTILMTILATACDVKEIGSTATTGTEGGATEGDASATGGATDMGSGLAGFGASCDHNGAPIPGWMLVSVDEGCGGGACIYADQDEPPPGPCTDDAYCTKGSGAAIKFQCNLPDGASQGTCGLRPDYFLARSFCSETCEVNADCATMVDTNCTDGFSCQRIQAVGELCCQALCVCNDDVGPNYDLDEQCEIGAQDGCCVVDGTPVDPQPLGCG